jgi:protein TonB
MKRAIILAAGVMLAATLALAQWPERGEPKFVAPQVAATAPAPYPPNSIAEGTVILELTIGPGGNIEGVQVVRGVASLTEAAERSVRQWKFCPATLEGRPVRADVAVAFTFTRPVVLPQKPAE